MKLKDVIARVASAKTTVMSIATMLGSVLVAVNVVAQGNQTTTYAIDMDAGPLQTITATGNITGLNITASGSGNVTAGGFFIGDG